MFRQNKQRTRKSQRRENHSFRQKRRNDKAEPISVHFMEYNPDTPQSVRQRRWMRRKREFKIGLAVIGCIGLLALLRVVVKEAFLDNKDFSLQNVSVITRGSLSPERLVKEARVVQGQNLLMISLSAVRERLERLPEVQKAGVSRRFPGLLELKVEQRQPVARLQFAQELHSALTQTAGYGCLVDADGVVLSEANYHGARLPVIVMDQSMLPMPGQSLKPSTDVSIQGTDPQQSRGAQVEVEQVLAAIHLLQLHRNSPLANSMEITKIDASGTYALRAEYGQSGPVVIYSNRDLEKQMRRFEAVHQLAEKKHLDLSTLNLLVERNVPVTFRQAGSPANESSRVSHHEGVSRKGLAAAN